MRKKKKIPVPYASGNRTKGGKKLTAMKFETLMITPVNRSAEKNSLRTLVMRLTESGLINLPHPRQLQSLGSDEMPTAGKSHKDRWPN